MGSTAETVATSASLMAAFAEHTGLTTDRPDRRYLWTDAFAVCNFLELARTTGQAHYSELALRLVDRVHHVLGRHRGDDSRTGWISGLDEAEGESHPTRGGLRIGKKLAERRREEPFDERLEWERDGQYFHYLTKWMHALDSVARSLRQPHFHLWARELAKVAYEAFVYEQPTPGHRRMFWKMSIDLSRPLVASMGQHDPLDGFITCVELQTTASRLPVAENEPSLREEIRDFASMIDQRSLATADPLGLGGLLSDAARLAQLIGEGASSGHEQLMEALLVAAHEGLSHYSRRNDLRQPSSQRLAFRELGLGIGLSAIQRVASLRRSIEVFEPYFTLGSRIQSFWANPEHRRSRSWQDHQDINDVMLANSLLPEGSILLPPA
jgi:hypothetical protein